VTKKVLFISIFLSMPLLGSTGANALGAEPLCSSRFEPNRQCSGQQICKLTKQKDNLCFQGYYYQCADNCPGGSTTSMGKAKAPGSAQAGWGGLEKKPAAGAPAAATTAGIGMSPQNYGGGNPYPPATTAPSTGTGKYTASKPATGVTCRGEGGCYKSDALGNQIPVYADGSPVNPHGGRTDVAAGGTYYDQRGSAPPANNVPAGAVVGTNSDAAVGGGAGAGSEASPSTVGTSSGGGAPAIPGGLNVSGSGNTINIITGQVSNSSLGGGPATGGKEGGNNTGGGKNDLARDKDGNPDPSGRTQKEIDMENRMKSEANLRDAEKATPYDRNGSALLSSDSSDACDTSNGLTAGTAFDTKSSCDTTSKRVKTAATTRQAIELGGALTTGVMGTIATARAQSSNGISDGLDATAKLQKTTSMLQIVSGAVNGFFGFQQNERASGHEETAKAIKTNVKNESFIMDKGDKNNDGTNAGEDGFIHANENNVMAKNARARMTFGSLVAVPDSPEHMAGGVNSTNENARQVLLAKREKGKIAKMGQLNEFTTSMRSRGSQEQNQAAEQAANGATDSFVAAATQTVQGIFNYMGAKQLEQASEKLKNIQQPGSNLAPSYGSDAVGDGSGARSAQVITGSGKTAEQSAAIDPGSDTNTTGMGDLGPQQAYGTPPNTTPQGPTPGNPVAKGPTGAPGGGGGGAPGGSVSTPPAQAKDDRPPAQLPMGSNPNSYAAGGTPGGGQANKNGAGPDLSGLLGKLLNFGGEEKKPTDSILSYGTASRNPASEGGAFFGANVNLFRRVHDTLQKKQGEGRVGVGI
jgi:hypothetical protein